MRSGVGSAAAIAAALLTVGGTAVHAQCAPETVDAGILAYQELRLDEAATLLRSAVDGMDRPAGAPCPERERALAFLGAAELYRGREDAARRVFTDLALLNPRFHPDSVAFPPRVTEAFEEARSEARAVAVALPDRSEIRVGLDSLSVHVFATSPQPVMVSLERVGSAQQRTLYLGPGRDSMVVAWDGLGADGAPASPGRYVLTAAPLDTTGAVTRSARVPIVLDYPGTGSPLTPVPSAAPTNPWSAALSVGGALLGGAAVIALPRLIGGGDGATWRYVVAGGLAVSGVAGVTWGSANRQQAWPLLRIRNDRGPLATDPVTPPSPRW